MLTKFRPKNGVQAVFSQTKAGYWTLWVRAHPIKPAPNGDHSIYTLVDENSEIDALVNCDGEGLKPKFIFKVYCKPSEMKRKKIVRQKALERARKRSPMLH